MIKQFGTGHNVSRQAVSRHKTVRRVFLNANGLRSGWGAFLFLAVYAGLSALAGAGLGQFAGLASKGPLPPISVLLQESSDALSLLIALWLMARIEKRQLSSFGYRDDHALRRLISGAACGILSLSALVLVLWKAGLLVFDGFALAGGIAWKYALGWALIAALVGFFEESLLRGYLQYTLTRGMGFWPAAVLLSLAFALWHVSNGGESILGLTVVGLGGLVFCLSLWFTRSLWWAIGFHAGWDWGQTYLYGTPDSGVLTQGHLLISHPSGSTLWSGGSAGPEGSILMLPLLLALAVGMWIWWGWQQLRRRSVQ